MIAPGGRAPRAIEKRRGPKEWNKCQARYQNKNNLIAVIGEQRVEQLCAPENDPYDT
jgi:hypothetical protein